MSSGRRITSVFPVASVVCLILIFVVGGGCSEPRRETGAGGGRESGWSQITLPNVTPDAAFEAGTYAMQQWFRISDKLPADGTLRSFTEEYEQKGGTGRIRDGAIGYKNRMRRTATLLVLAQPSGCVVKCHVQVERLDTADHRVFRSNEQFEDVPNETPIDREAAVSSRQDQAWTPMPRDRGLERKMLDVLRNHLGLGDSG